MRISFQARRLFCSLCLCLGLGPALAQAEQPLPLTSATSIWGEALRTVDDDARAILRAPFKDGRRTGLFLAGIGALVLLDEPLTRAYRNTVESAFDGFALPELPWEDSLRPLGLASEDVWMLSGMAIGYGYGLLAGDERAQRAALLSGKALAYSFVTSQLVLKSLIARKRPCADLDLPDCDDGTFTDNPLDFGNYHGISVAPDAYGTSMPSYHFTQYFAAARVYSGLYGDSWAPYGLAGLLAVSNIRGHRHWVSDMVAGTALGLGIGEIVLRNAEADRAGRLTAAPVMTGDGGGVALNMAF